MLFPPRTLSCSLSPNTQCDDVLTALRTLCQPWIWNTGSYQKKARYMLRSYFNTPHIFLFSSGRSSLTFILQALGVGKGDEVILQAFTCTVVANSIRFAGATPVFADIDASLNFDPYDIRNKITKKTKAIIVQHTFGIPAEMNAILRIAKENKLMIIEDLAHGFGGTVDGKKLGTLGNAAFLSFGRDKVLSSVMGGAAVFLKPVSKPVINRAKKSFSRVRLPSRKFILSQLLHPVLFSFILPLYSFWIFGKLFIVIFQKLRILSMPVEMCEKRGIQPVSYIRRFPNALAALLVNQLMKLNKYSRQRTAVSMYYQNNLGMVNMGHINIPDNGNLPLLRFPLYVTNAPELITSAKRRHILLGNWYHNVIDPEGTDKKTLKYSNNCLKAEDIAHHIVNLPTRISLGDAKRVVKTVHTILSA